MPTSPIPVENHNAGAADKYPNRHSYAMSSFSARGTPGNKLRRAVLYSAKKTTSEGAQPGIFGPSPGSAPYLKQSSEIITTLSKPFQFNPPTMLLGINVAPTDPEEAELEGGTAAQAGGYIGTAGTSVEMLFERSIEVQGMSGEYGRLGVAKDVLDVIAVLRGDATLLEASDDKSLREFTHMLTDLVGNASKVLMAYRAAIVYSQDLVLYGLVTNMNIRFLQFNHDLIPTMGYVDLTFDIHNATNTAGMMSQAVGATTASNTGTPTDVVAKAWSNVTTGWGNRNQMTDQRGQK
jgi:hypothetical protein